MNNYVISSEPTDELASYKLICRQANHQIVVQKYKEPAIESLRVSPFETETTESAIR